MPGEPIRVLIADDQALIREGLALLLGQFGELEVVGVASDGESAVAMATELRPDVVLMDLVMPGMDGVDATRQIVTMLPRTQVVILSAYADDESIFAAISAGASGYLTKDSGAEQIRRAIATVQAGGALLDPHVQKRLLDHQANNLLEQVEANPAVAAWDSVAKRIMTAVPELVASQNIQLGLVGNQTAF